MNKKGKASAFAWFLGVAALTLVVVLIVGGTMFFPQLTGIGAELQEQRAQVITQASKLGDAATLKLIARDSESNNNDQVASYVYAFDSEDGVLIADNTSLSATARTSVSTSIGKELDVIAFDGSYNYEAPKVVTINKEIENVDLVTHAIITTSLKVTAFDDGSSLAGGLNLTLAASQTDAADKLKLEVNASDVSFNFKAIAVNVTTATNIDDVNINGLTECAVPRRLNTVVDWMFCLDEAELMSEFDTYETSSVTFEAKGNDPSETGTFIFLDEAYFRSADGKSIKKDMETDFDTEVDVGALDGIGQKEFTIR